MIGKLKKLGTLEIILVAVVIVFVGALALYAGTHTTSTTTDRHAASTDTAMMTHPDTSGTFSIAHPHAWNMQPYTWEPCCDGAVQPEPDWTQTPQPLTLVSAANKHAQVQIKGDRTGAQTIDAAYDARTQDAFNTYSKLTINGADALYRVTDYTGPGNAERYKDHRWLIVKGNVSVRVEFRERYSNATLDGAKDFAATKQLSDVRAIVDSVTFLGV